MGKKTTRVPPPEMIPGLMLIDSHCHLDMDDYQSDLAEVLERAVGGGVSRIITIGIDLPSSRQACQLAAANPRLFGTVGIHPHNTQGVTARDYTELADLASRPEVVGYGEIGLDYVKMHAPREVQLEHFRYQIGLGKELNLPLIIHDRGAHEDVMTILRQEAPFPAGGVMHCFSGDPDLALEVLDLGFYLSIPGVVTFDKAEKLHEVVRKVPLSSLLLETDGPYLAPVPYRGKRNEPFFLLYTAQKVAQLREVELATVAMQTTENCENLFRLKEGRHGLDSGKS